jgi:hypothetical protein
MGRLKLDTLTTAVAGAWLGLTILVSPGIAADCDIEMESGSWSDLSDLPIDRHENATAKLEIGGSEYIFFFAQRNSDTVVRYDITNDTWATSDDGGSAGAPPLRPPAFSGAGLGDHKKALTIGNTLYLIGGTRPFDETLWSYDGINSATQLSSIGCSGESQSCSGQLRVGAFSAALLDGDIFIAGGHCNVTGGNSANCTCNGVVGGTSGDCAGNAGGPGENTDRAFRYDPSSDDWTAIADIPIGVDHGSGAAFDGKFYVFGGRQCGTDTACEGRTHTQIYDPDTNTWSFGASMPEGCSGMGHAAVLNDRIYVIGGEGGACTKVAVQEYDPVDDSWRTVTSLPDSHHGMTPIVVGDPNDGVPDRILLGSGRPTSSTRHMHEFQFTCEPCGVGCQSCSSDGDCDDGDFCNGPETCNGDTCQAGADPCPGQACDEGANACVECTNDNDCDDGDTCNGDETCNVGNCSAGSAPDCDDGLLCTIDSCDELFGCISAPTDCSDGNACTTDSCNAANGLCEHEPIPCSDPDNDGLLDADDPCPTDPRNLCFGFVATDDATGNDIRLNANVSGAECSGDKTDCNGDLWHADYAYNLSLKASSCNLNGGGEACIIAGIPDLFGCEDETTEDIFQCEHSDNATAPELVYDFDVPDDDYLVNIFFASTYDGTLDVGDRTIDIIIEGVVRYDDFDQVAAAGNARAVLRSAVVTVSDGNGLQVEFGHENGNPAFKAIEVLLAGECIIDAHCDDGVFCNGNETCNASSCVAGTAPGCNDSVGCTTDSCNEETDSCDHTASDAVCDDGAFCNGPETCNPALDCQSGNAPDCSDGVACTTDSCNEATDSCDHTVSNAACDDGAFCNGVETCHPTLDCQAGTPHDCSDGVPCTVDSCDETGDVCDHTPDDNACDDGAFCNGPESCSPTNGCEAGTAPPLDDGVECTTDACDEMSDAVTHVPSDALCDDELFCNGNEACDVVQDCMGGTAPNIDDGIACTTDACDETNDEVTHTPSDNACDDGAFCDGVEICSSVLGCVQGSMPCIDGVTCTIDGCDETLDECIYAPSDEQCSDGALCNGEEQCDTDLGCQSGTGPDCSNDDTACATYACDEDAGGCLATMTNEGGSCEDGNLCTLDDTCVEGSCIRSSHCGVPVSGALAPTATDALFALRTSVGLEVCALCECDVNASGTTTVSDALTILSVTVGIDASLACYFPIEQTQ